MALTIEQATRLGAAIDDTLSFLEKHRFKGEAAKKAEDLTVTLGTERFQLARRIGQVIEGNERIEYLSPRTIGELRDELQSMRHVGGTIDLDGPEAAFLADLMSTWIRRSDR